MRGSVYGYVVVAPAGDPVPGATIVGMREADSHLAERVPSGRHEIRTRTDSSGRFGLDGLREGQWVLQMRGAGNEALGSTTVPVFDNSVSEVTIAVGILPPPWTAPRHPSGYVGSVHGRVVRESGKPVAGATISIVSGEGAEPDVAPVTDSDGWFLIDGLATGTWLLRAAGPGGENGTATVHVLEDEVAEVTVEVGAIPKTPRRGTVRPSRMERGMSGSIRGVVVLGDMAIPVRDASVTVVRGAGPAPDISPLTDDDGRFVLDDLPAGEWILRAEGPNGETGTASVRVTRGVAARVVITIDKPSASKR